MIAYQYKHGDKPLEGYTIQRAAGRGGFGEVYYAVSDAGREVALKLVQGYEQIELRGISHCMNLKSPHLVSIFDVRYGSDRRPWVIMEYVAGPTLRQLIDDRPAGLGLQKSIFFLREIAKGLTTLHDCGVVHRDLKPGNVFFENGYVKIGDYGLSKAMTVSQHSGQTVTVGTVHYMAPEIGVGRYDKSIDVYALGIMLYEMITGVVPFNGASPSEILMKHLAAEPDLTGVDEFLAGVIRKALAKKPTDRYGSAQELVEAVFGAEHVRQSVSHFSVEDLTMVAGRVARQAGATAASPAAAVFATPPASSVTRIGEDVSPAERWRRQAGMSDADPTPALPPGVDPLPIGYRLLLAGLGAAAIAAAAAGVSDSAGRNDSIGVGIFMAAWGGATGLIVGNNVVRKRMQFEAQFIQRLVPVGLAMALASLATIPALSAETHLTETLPLGKVAFQCIIVLFLNATDLFKLTLPTRRTRLDFRQVLLAGGAAWVAGMIVENRFYWIGVGIVTAMAVVTQFVARWTPMPADVLPGTQPRRPSPEEPRGTKGRQRVLSEAGSSPRPILAGVSAAILFSVGVGCFIAGSNSHSSSDEAIFSGLTVGLFALSAGAGRLAVLERVRGLWRDILRPIAFAVAAGFTVGLFAVAQQAHSGSDSAIFGSLATLGLLLSLGLIAQSLVQRNLRADRRRRHQTPAMAQAFTPPAATPLPRADHGGTAADRSAVVPPPLPAAAMARATPASSRWIRGLSPFALLMGIIGYSLLSIGQVAGLASAVDVPGMIDSGFLADATLRQTLASLNDSSIKKETVVMSSSAARRQMALAAEKLAALPQRSKSATTRGVRAATTSPVAGSTPAHSTATDLKRLVTSERTIRALQGLQALRGLQVKLAASSMEAIVNAARDSADTTGDDAIEETLRSLRANAAALLANLPPEAATNSEAVQELDPSNGEAASLAPGATAFRSFPEQIKAAHAFDANPPAAGDRQRASGVALARSALTAAWVLLTAAATVFLLLARRSRGASHMVRGVIGVALVTIALLPFYASFGDGRFWPYQVGNSLRIAMMEFADRATKACVVSTILSVPAMVLIAWPPRLGRREAVAA